MLCVGWQLIDGAADSADGRKVFIRGKVPGSGCWFSTDYLAEDLWVFFVPTVNSIQVCNLRSTLWCWCRNKKYCGLLPDENVTFMRVDDEHDALAGVLDCTDCNRAVDQLVNRWCEAPVVPTCFWCTCNGL